MSSAQAPSTRMLRELLGYGGASVIALAVDIGLLEMSVRTWGWNYIPASMTAFVSGGIVAYILSVKFVFQYHRVRRRSLELTCFVALGTVGIAVNTLVLSLAVQVAGIGLLAAKGCAAGCTFATNFALRRNLLFATDTASGRP